MAKFDPTKSAQRWADKVANSGAAFTDGVNGTQKDPARLAIARKDTLKARFNAAVDSGQWERALGAVTPQAWKTAAVAGASRYTDGARKGQPKMQRYMQKAAPILAAIQAEISAMPNVTDADRKARMNRNMDLMKQLKGISKQP